MLLTLSIDVGDSTPDERAHISGLLAETLARGLRHGHTGTLSMVDLAEDAEVSDAEVISDYRRGFRDGYGDGYSDGHHQAPRVKAADRGHTGLTLPGPDLYDFPPDALARAEKIADRATIARADQAQAVHVPGATIGSGGSPTSAHTFGIQREYDTDVFPPVMPVPDTAAEPAPWLYSQVAAELQAALPPQIQRPDGDRPSPGPGAPVSAYDVLTPDVAESAFGFPPAATREPSASGGWFASARTWTDSEGARWAYMPNRNQWDRRTYPTEWGAAPKNVIPTMYVTDADI